MPTKTKPKSRYHGRQVMLVIPHPLFDAVERLVAAKRAAEPWRTVSRNEVLCGLIAAGVGPGAGGSKP